MMKYHQKVDEIKNSAEDNSIESYYIVKLIKSALDFDSNLFNSTYERCSGAWYS